MKKDPQRTEQADAPSPSPKRPYRPPVLAKHGNLRTVAQAKGGGANDGSGKPRTKAGGPPA